MIELSVRIVLALMMVVIFSVANAADEAKCGDNEFYNACGSACQATCTFTPQLCTLQCVSGCFCKPGFVRKSNETGSPCVPESECQNYTCPDPNAEYTTCGSFCARNCDDVRNPSRPLRFCPAICVRGCFCKQGFVRENNGRCVRPEQCCREIHGIYKTCGPSCPQTCGNNQPCSRCTSGCFCAPDYVRKSNETNSPCIPTSAC